MSKKNQSKNEDMLDPETVDETMEAAKATETAGIEALQTQIETLEAESAKNLEGWQRAQAEFINYRKRMEREQVRMYADATVRVIRQFLPLLDDLKRALQDKPQNGEAAEWANGIELVYRKMLTILENEGVIVMDVEGEQFDPNFHEAIAQVESPDHESGQIVEVIQQGYMIGERVLRAALVRVAS
ncbi:nucleotide exchange factor GrpE [bacterium]|nr:nucleotide exchange factor GrpE [bacterium]